MESSFVTYIDESGDEGFTFRDDGSGSSRWFVISAVVIRQSDDCQMVSCLKEVRRLLGKPPKFSLHFADLKHEQRIPYIRRIGQLPLRSVTVLVYKSMILEPEKFQSSKYLLYRYATRMLLERVSWLCRDHRKTGEGDGSTEIVFSNRSNMSYEEIRNYLRLLAKQAQDNPLQVQFDNMVVDPERICSVEHSKLAGLQIADAVAGGIHFAVKRNRYGEAEPACLPHLKKTLYRHKGEVFGYGLKVWPEDVENIKTKAPEVLNLEGL